MINFVDSVFVVKIESSYYFLFKTNTSVTDIFGIFIKLLSEETYTVFKNKIFFKEDVLIPVELLPNYYTQHQDSILFTLSETASTFQYLFETNTNVHPYIFKYTYSNLKEYSEDYFDVSILNTEEMYVFCVPKNVVNTMAVNSEKVKGTSEIVLFYNKIVNTDITKFSFTVHNDKLFVLSVNVKGSDYNLLATKEYLTKLNLIEYSLDFWHPEKSFSNLTKQEFKRFIKLNFNLDIFNINIIQPGSNVDFFVTKKSIFNE